MPRKKSQTAKATSKGKPGQVRKANTLIRDDIPLGQKREYTLQQCKQSQDSSWAISVSKEGSDVQMDDNVVIKSIGYRPRKGDKVVIERQPDESVSKDNLALMRA